MLFSDGFGVLNFNGLMLGQFVNSDPEALRWSIQPGVSGGGLELFSKLEAAYNHIEVVGRHWLGVASGGPPLSMVQLQIRADRLHGFIQRGMMAFEDGKLKVFAQLVRGAELYSFIVSHHGSVSAIISAPPPPDRSVPGDWRLYGGFLKACVDCVDWSVNGIHWNMQPGAYGRITLYLDPKLIAEKYAYYQKPASGTGPEIVQVVLCISEQAAGRIMSSGALVQGDRHGTFYMYVNMYDAVYFDQQHEELAYTATVHTV